MTHKVVVGLSGGVDSSVSILRLKEAGYEVSGVFTKNWEEDDDTEHCPAERDSQDAEAVCAALKVPFYRINFSYEYWERVFAHFLSEYQAGRTPNPDILCNREIKFGCLMRYANMLGATYLATGHYARKKKQDGLWQLLVGVDTSKDQSYFLYTLRQDDLEHTLFPVGDLCKKEVRAFAQRHGLEVYDKKDSTGICFIGERKFKDFLARYLPAQPGEVCDETGRVLGTHEGLMYYTLGQRAGLGLGGMSGYAQAPWFVAAKDIATNRLVVVQGHEHPALFRQHLNATELTWVAGRPPADDSFTCCAKIRYRQQAMPCRVGLRNQHAHVVFETPQRAITPGQSVVFYEGDVCLGGGVIE